MTRHACSAQRPRGRRPRRSRRTRRRADRRTGRIPRKSAVSIARPDGADELDLARRTITPGLMNAHSHICLDGTSPDPEAVLREETPATNAVRSAARLRADPRIRRHVDPRCRRAVGRGYRASPARGGRRDPRAAHGHVRPQHLHDRRTWQLDGPRGRWARGPAARRSDPDQGRGDGDQGDVDRRDDDAQPARRRAAADGRGDDSGR